MHAPETAARMVTAARAFGDPGSARWAWSVGGHHVGVHFTLVGESIASTPLFLGANPAQVRHGTHTGLRTLPEEEDLARTLLHALAPENRRLAIVGATAPHDILTDVRRQVRPEDAPSGLLLDRMSADERELAVRLARLYIDRAAPEIARRQWQQIEKEGIERISFAWLGGSDPGAPHHYALRGPSFRVEYNKTRTARIISIRYYEVLVATGARISWPPTTTTITSTRESALLSHGGACR